MRQITNLNLDELKQIYKEHVREDFPRNERRPYSSMEKLTHEGKYASYGYYENDNLLAYACYFLAENDKYALLDYFAVIPEQRDHGIGSEFLQKLQEESIVKRGTFIEAESPSSAKNDEEERLRKRRIQFYLSNGAVLTDSKCLLFGVDYNIMYIVGQGGDVPLSDQLHQAVEKLYREIYRPFYGRFCKPYIMDADTMEGEADEIKERSDCG